MKALNTSKLALASVFMVSLMTLTACGDNYLYKPTFRTAQKIQVKKQVFERVMPTVLLDEGEIAHISSHYRGHGEGQVEILVTYNPNVSGNSAIRATDEAARIADTLRHNGIEYIQANIMPVQEEDSKAMISYVGYTAEKPAGCKNMLDDPDDYKHALAEYELGCTYMDLITRQVARPKDLLGQDRVSPNQGSRDAAVVSGYRAYEPITIENQRTSDQ